MFESENSEMIFNVQAAKASSRQDQGGGIRTIAGQSPSDFAFSMARYIGSKFSPEICRFWSVHSLSRWPSLAQLVSWKRDEASKCDGPDELCSLEARCKILEKTLFIEIVTKLRMIS